MARSKSFFGLRRGSAGGFTYSKGVNGEQITRAKAESVSNPRSKSQMAQRMLFASVAFLAKKFNYVVNHSTQGAKPRQQALSEFRSMNLRRLRDGNAYIINDDAHDVASVDSYAFRPWGAADNTIMFKNLKIADGDLADRIVQNNSAGDVWVDSNHLIPGSSNETWRDFLAACGLLQGDWLTFIVPNVGDSYDTQGIAYTLEGVDYVQFEVREDIPSTVLNGNALLATMADVFIITSSLSGVKAGLFTVSGGRGIGIQLANAIDYLQNGASVAVIHSRTDSDGNHRSPAYASLEAGNAGNFINSWPIGSALLLDGGGSTWEDGSVPIYTPGPSGSAPRPIPIVPSGDADPTTLNATRKAAKPAEV